MNGKNWVVLEISLLFTSFDELGQMVYVSNEILLQQTIYNIRRSDNMPDYITIVVDFETEDKKMIAVRKTLFQFVSGHPKRYRNVEPDMDLIDIGTNRSVSYRFSIEFLGNW